MAARAPFTINSFREPFASWMPGVATNTICAFSVFFIPRILFLVVWGFADTMAIFSPRIAFKRVDFPTLGRPMIATKPDLKDMRLKITLEQTRCQWRVNCKIAIKTLAILQTCDLPAILCSYQVKIALSWLIILSLCVACQKILLHAGHILNKS